MRKLRKRLKIIEAERAAFASKFQRRSKMVGEGMKREGLGLREGARLLFSEVVRGDDRATLDLIQELTEQLREYADSLRVEVALRRLGLTQ